MIGNGNGLLNFVLVTQPMIVGKIIVQADIEIVVSNRQTKKNTFRQKWVKEKPKKCLVIYSTMEKICVAQVGRIAPLAVETGATMYMLINMEVFAHFVRRNDLHLKTVLLLEW